MYHLRDTKTLKNQKCIIVVRKNHQISQDFSGYKNFFQDSKVGSKIIFEKSLEIS